jgi:hypothetical protein
MTLTGISLAKTLIAIFIFGVLLKKGNTIGQTPGIFCTSLQHNTTLLRGGNNISHFQCPPP